MTLNSRYFSTFLLAIFLVVFACNPTIEEEDDTIPLNPDNCTSALELSITEDNMIAIEDETNPIYWEGNYSDSSVRLSFSIPVGTDGESETFYFLFQKTENCIAIDRGYKYYDGGVADISAITAMEIKQLFIQEWREDEFLAAEIIYTDPHDKLTYAKKAWVNLETTEDNSNSVLLFESCLGNQFPVDVDIDNDGNTDFIFDVERIDDIGNNPKFSSYAIILKSANLDENQILSPINTREPYSVLFEPPFDSRNTRQYFNGVKSELDIFYEFEAPYDEYNFFVSNQLTYYENLNNAIDDYYLIKKVIDNQEYYGWIQFRLKVDQCDFELLDTYLSDTPNEAIFVSE